MPRELLPLTVYLPPEDIAEALQRAQDMSVAVGTLLRLILLGTQAPLRVSSSGRGGETASTPAS